MAIIVQGTKEKPMTSTSKRIFKDAVRAFSGAKTSSHMASLVVQYLNKNENLGKAKAKTEKNTNAYEVRKGFYHQAVIYGDAAISNWSNNDDNHKGKNNLIVICDDGSNYVPDNEVGYYMKSDKSSLDPKLQVPFMLDLNVDKHVDLKRLDLWQYNGAVMVSLDKDTLARVLPKYPDGRTLSISVFMKENKWDNLVINDGLHSFWFTNSGGDRIFDFKYKDGVENEATYNSKREIIAGLAAEYALNGYKMNDKVVKTVFRTYWPEGFESEKEISFDKLSKALGIPLDGSPIKVKKPKGRLSAISSILSKLNRAR